MVHPAEGLTAAHAALRCAIDAYQAAAGLLIGFDERRATLPAPRQLGRLMQALNAELEDAAADLGVDLEN